MKRKISILTGMKKYFGGFADEFLKGIWYGMGPDLRSKSKGKDREQRR